MIHDLKWKECELMKEIRHALRNFRISFKILKLKVELRELFFWIMLTNKLIESIME